MITTDNTQTYNLQTCYDDYVWRWTNPIEYPIYITREDKCSQAFRVLKTLVEKKVVNLKTTKDFISLMDEIIKVI